MAPIIIAAPDLSKYKKAESLSSLVLMGMADAEMANVSLRDFWKAREVSYAFQLPVSVNRNGSNAPFLLKILDRSHRDIFMILNITDRWKKEVGGGQGRTIGIGGVI